VAEGIRLAQANDLPAAERMLAEAAHSCPGPAPVRELAGVRLLQRRWSEVRERASQAIAQDPTDRHAWQLLGTSRFIERDERGALKGEALTDADVGAGLRIALPSGAGVLRADVAHGLRDGANAVSLAWTSAR
jgi:hypothetical protein